MTQQERFVAAARACIGTRWVHQGRLPGVGIDCVGLAVVAGAAVGLEFVDSGGYSRAPDGQSLMRALLANGTRVRGELQPGDILALSRADIPAHVAIYTGDGKIVHAWASIRRVVEHAYDAPWQDCLRGVFRPRWTE